MYEIYVDKSMFYVYYGQISDIIGEEPWIRSEVNCLCNVASERKVMLMLGAKKKETPAESTTIASTSSVQKISNRPFCPDNKSTDIFCGD